MIQHGVEILKKSSNLDPEFLFGVLQKEHGVKCRQNLTLTLIIWSMALQKL